ncbi:urea amidolyase family protein [Naasia sp. SYSU D00948]|uniref:5-oxoprolinase subunit B/C family protein n=1 Tax=Naasia sp. SYSU D00948 TaxID=2817379 RepID=UPI0027DC0355|nr:urea amidolyase family protein [Naasia sp. SYSU D00948]
MTTGLRPALAIRPMGDRALLVELESLDDVVALSAALRREPAPHQLDVVPAARTVLVRLGPDASHASAAAHVRNLDVAGASEHGVRRHELRVLYDGPDLADVAALLGVTEDGFVARHASVVWTVAFTGFAPGFAYLVSPGLGIRVPRRPSPRTSVPAGSVALADEFSGVYPRDSPGGWQLVGRTDAVLWDADRERPALLAPGDTVAFRPVRELVVAAAPEPSADPPSRPAGLTVLDPGLATTVQDRGRLGWASLGVSTSGAADRRSYDAANRAVGNVPGAAALESTLGGLSLRAERELVVAVTGARAPLHTVGATGARRTRTLGRPFALRLGEVLELGLAESGLRSYLAVRGGLDVPAQLGSRSSDTLSGLGPARLRAGDGIPVGDDVAGPVVLPSVEPPSAPAGVATLRVIPGPREDWITEESRRLLEEQTWRVGVRSDRVGLRLEGVRPLERSRPGEIPSEGMVAGALQVPPDGQPVLFLADHPVTGGYPVVGVVAADDLPIAGQLPPGSQIRFAREEP